MPTLEETDGAGDLWPEATRDAEAPTADPPAPMRTFDDLLIACQRSIGGALRERVRRVRMRDPWGGWSAIWQRLCRFRLPGPPE